MELDFVPFICLRFDVLLIFFRMNRYDDMYDYNILSLDFR